MCEHDLMFYDTLEKDKSIAFFDGDDREMYYLLLIVYLQTARVMSWNLGSFLLAR